MTHTSNAQGVAVLIACCTRPRTSPTTLNMLYCGLWICQGTLLLNEQTFHERTSVLALLSAMAAFTNTVICLIMPMRDQGLGTDNIGQASKLPDGSLRSPEDNLNLLQFFSVSWMSSLISVGSKRQLNDEDVWQLSWEFQHRRLHENFRELRGSVVRRLLKANWIDLTLTTLFALLKMMAGKSVLKQ